MKNKKYSIGGFLFVGCMFIGMGIGTLLNAMQTGILIGMGAGFVSMALTQVMVKDKKNNKDN